jgi:5-methylcytosine-specific restriction endonuclease McrA
MLAPHLSEKNLEQVMGQARGQSKRELEKMVAELSPKPCVKTRIRKLPQARETHARLPLELSTATTPTAPAPSQRPQKGSTPLGKQRYSLQLTCSETLIDKIDELKALMSHRDSTGDVATLLEAAVDELLVRLRKERLAETQRPGRRARKSKNRNRRIPAQVKRRVYAQDGQRCSFTSKNGKRCRETHFLEMDHRVPFARGGEHSVENLRVRCRAHNQQAARKAYGAEFMAAKVSGVTNFDVSNGAGCGQWLLMDSPGTA